MDIEILAEERAHHRRFRLIYRALLILILTLGSIGLVYAGFQTNQRAGWIVTVGLVVIAAVVTTMALRMDRRRPDQLVTTGPWSWGQVYSGHQQREIWNSMGKVLSQHGLGFRRLTNTTGLSERGGTFVYRKGHHLLDVRPSEDHPGWLVITVQSAPDLPTTITDFGRGAAINDDLLNAVPGFRRPDDPELG